MEVKIVVRGIEQISAFIKTVPHGTTRVALKAIAEWFIGTPERGLRRYSPYKYITRARAYGQTFVSDKQRRYVMARIREGSIDPGAPHRTGQTQRGWYATPTNGGYGYTIKNDTPGAYYTRHNTGQARLNALAGWRKVREVIETNIKGAMRHANAAVRAFLKGK